MGCILRFGAPDAIPTFSSADVLGGADYAADETPDNTALFQQFDALAASVANKGYAFAALIDAQAGVDADVGTQVPNLVTVDSDSSEGCLSGLRTCVRAFFAKLASWWSDGEANRAIKNAFRNAFEGQLGRIGDESRRNEIKQELDSIANPSSDWPLDMREVRQLIVSAGFEQSARQHIAIYSSGRSGAARSAGNRAADLGGLINPELDAAFEGMLNSGAQQVGAPSYIARSLASSRIDSIDDGDMSDDEGMTQAEHRFRIPARRSVDLSDDSDEDTPARGRLSGPTLVRHVAVPEGRGRARIHAEEEGKARDGDDNAALTVSTAAAAVSRGALPPLDRDAIRSFVQRPFAPELVERPLSENLDIALTRKSLMSRSVGKSVVTNMAMAMLKHNSLTDAVIAIQNEIHVRFAGDNAAADRAVAYLQAVRAEVYAMQQARRRRG